jgi:hypothetical protein
MSHETPLIEELIWSPKYLQFSLSIDNFSYQSSKETYIQAARIPVCRVPPPNIFLILFAKCISSAVPSKTLPIGQPIPFEKQKLIRDKEESNHKLSVSLRSEEELISNEQKKEIDLLDVEMGIHSAERKNSLKTKFVLEGVKNWSCLKNWRCLKLHFLHFFDLFCTAFLTPSCTFLPLPPTICKIQGKI